MNYQYIEQLLDRYWNCETTLEEEQILRSFFSQADVPSHLKQYAAFFAYEATQKEEKLGEDFDKRILAMTEEKQAVEAKTVKLSTRIAPFFKAAAVVAVVLTIGNIAERALRDNSVSDTTVGVTDTYIKKEDITAKIKIIDHTRSEAMAKTDSLKTQTPAINQDPLIIE